MKRSSGGTSVVINLSVTNASDAEDKLAAGRKMPRPVPADSPAEAVA